MKITTLKTGEGFLQFLKTYHTHLNKVLRFPKLTGIKPAHKAAELFEGIQSAEQLLEAIDNLHIAPPKNFIIPTYDSEKVAFNMLIAYGKLSLNEVDEAIKITGKCYSRGNCMDVEALHCYTLMLLEKYKLWEPNVSQTLMRIIYLGNIHLGAEFRLGTDKLPLKESANRAYIDAHLKVNRNMVYQLSNNKEAIDIYLNLWNSTGCDIAREMFIKELTKVINNVYTTNNKFIQECEGRGLFKLLNTTSEEITKPSKTKEEQRKTNSKPIPIEKLLKELDNL